METQIATLILVMRSTTPWRGSPAAGDQPGVVMLVRPDFASGRSSWGCTGSFMTQTPFQGGCPVALAHYLPGLCSPPCIRVTGSQHHHCERTGIFQWYTTPDALSPAGVAGMHGGCFQAAFWSCSVRRSAGTGLSAHLPCRRGAQPPWTGAGRWPLPELRSARRAAGGPCGRGRFRGGLHAVLRLLVPIIFLWYKMPYVASLSFLVAVGTHAVTGWMGRRALFRPEPQSPLPGSACSCVILPGPSSRAPD
jgi:hypothetical protein